MLKQDRFKPTRAPRSFTWLHCRAGGCGIPVQWGGCLRLCWSPCIDALTSCCHPKLKASRGI